MTEKIKMASQTKFLNKILSKTRNSKRRFQRLLIDIRKKLIFGVKRCTSFFLHSVKMLLFIIYLTENFGPKKTTNIKI
jgi:hypothetical protein